MNEQEQIERLAKRVAKAKEEARRLNEASGRYKQNGRGKTHKPLWWQRQVSGKGGKV